MHPEKEMQFVDFGSSSENIYAFTTLIKSCLQGVRRKQYALHLLHYRRDIIHHLAKCSLYNYKQHLQELKHHTRSSTFIFY